MISLLLLLSCTDKADPHTGDTDSDTDADTDADTDTDTADTGVSSCPGADLTVGTLAYTGDSDPGMVIATATLSAGVVCSVTCDDPWFEVVVSEDCTGPTTFPVELTAPDQLCLVLAVVPERDPAETTCTVEHSPGTETVLDVVVTQ